MSSRNQDAMLPFNYHLPSDLIAQSPATPRDSARLMIVDRSNQTFEHGQFRGLGDHLNDNDVLVLNNTRVIPARLLGKREATGGKWEGLFIRRDPDGLWELLCQTRGNVQPGEAILLEDHQTRLIFHSKSEPGIWRMLPPPGRDIDLLERIGHVPLPPYIRRGRDQAADRMKYQTVYARTQGAIAAPTAGLHFTEGLLAQLRGRGISLAELTLHVGIGTFQPIRGALEQHQMHSEWGELTESEASKIRRCRIGGGSAVAVGTTSVRVLETSALAGELQPWKGETSLFIKPPFQFRVVDCLITNFHLPGTTLLALVAAFMGTELCRQAYELAVRERYRFYSYGDAMLIQ